jgi:threonine dehydrogenase-like Zn-dependent dehydrogenase
MRAFVVTGPGTARVRQVEEPRPGPGEVVVAVERAGICGTDVEFFTGTMAYLHSGEARYPIRLGHEWCGTVDAVGDGVDPAWRGRRVTGDTMLGCGHCPRCRSGRQHLCADRYEIGIRGGWPGALAERLPVPVRALHVLPDAVDAALGALVEPGGSALRAVRAAALAPGERLLVAGPGTLGLIAAQMAAAQGVEVHLLGVTPGSLEFARSLGFAHAFTARTLPDTRYDAVVDASNGPRYRPWRSTGSNPAAGWCSSGSPANRACWTAARSRSRTSPSSASSARPAASPVPSTSTPAARWTRGRWSRRRSGWTTRLRRWPGSGAPGGARARRS